MEAEQVVRYEELSLNLWPARTFVFYDGWIVGMSDGYTRRANCVVPLRSGHISPRAKISRCEGLFESAGLRTCFKLTEHSQPPGLDAALAELGYGREAETFVEVVALDGEHGKPAHPAADIVVADSVTPRWLEAHSRLHGLDERDRAALSATLDRICLPMACALVADGDGDVACGLCTIDGDTAGLFGIAVAETKRRQGLGRRITTALLAWARGARASKAFLQVTLANEGARALYAGMGFAEVYRYWYRAKGQGAAPAAGRGGPTARR